MQREIKFRAWDKDNKEMLLNGFVINADGVVATISNDHDWDLILMQYTGLKDKNGKEIYEGDIISGSENEKYQVSWNEKYASFCIWKKGWAFYHFFGEAIDPDKIEVIGNIYENPELLNG